MLHTIAADSAPSAVRPRVLPAQQLPVSRAQAAAPGLATKKFSQMTSEPHTKSTTTKVVGRGQKRKAPHQDLESPPCRPPPRPKSKRQIKHTKAALAAEFFVG